MKLQLKKTIEYDGEWLKIYKDDSLLQSFKLDVDYRTNEEAMQRAEDTFQFILQNGDTEVILKEVETKEL